ncbi:MAG: PAS domain S-box protein [Spirochaetaceae bacterium]|nr:MAG: PAS domain S-box protein [Spirochaetaceae bacterium]
MRRFLQRALEKIEKMDRSQIRKLVSDIAGENELLEMVMESMSDGVLVTDREDRILMVNKSAERMLPFTSEELIEKPLGEAIADEEIREFFTKNLRGLDRVLDREFTLGNGYSRILSLSIMPLVRQGWITGNVIHIEDVTDKRAREARLRRAESLAALTTLTAGVAHEIKNPLGSIGIHLELMKKEMNGKKQIETRKVMENLHIIKEEVDRLNRIVMDFLFTVRPMNAELSYDDLNRVIQELLEFMKPELAEAGITLESELTKSSPQILMDERYMKQAVLNLLKNAISAMPEGGQLRVRTMQRGNELHLQIGDTGVGIPEENMDKIFEPYFTTKDFGSGLGLTLVYKIVKEHLGDIEVNSKVGEGTTITLSFPIPQKEKRLISYSEGAP